MRVLLFLILLLQFQLKLEAQKGQFKELPLFLHKDSCILISYNSHYLNESATSSTFCQIGLKSYKKTLWLKYFTTSPNIELQFNLSANDSLKYFTRVYIQDTSGIRLISCNGLNAKADKLGLSVIGLNTNKHILIEFLTNEDTDQNLEVCLSNLVIDNTLCENAIKICSKQRFRYNIKKIEQVGKIQNSCLEEDGVGVWFKWKIKNSGNLNFILNFDSKTVNDLDFALYKSDSNMENCSKLSLVRCSNASSKTTGLSEFSDDQNESGPFADGFVRSIFAGTNEVYFLYVRNFYTNYVGFELTFSGDAILYGEKPTFDSDYNTQTIKCNSTNQFYLTRPHNSKDFKTMTWEVRDGSKVSSYTNLDSLTYKFSNFGLQTVTLLTVDSFSCYHVESKDYFINECCQVNKSEIKNITVQENECFGEQKAVLIITPQDQTVQYKSKIINIDNFPINSLVRSGLKSGIYLIAIFDSLGCSDTTQFSIIDPEKFEIYFTDQNINKNLGDNYDLTLKSNQQSKNITYKQENVQCPFSIFDNNDNQEIKIKGNNTIIANAINHKGCMAFDTLNIKIKNKQELICANVINTKSIKENLLKCYINNEIIESIDFSIFDRFGNIIYNARNLKSGEAISWDGTLNGVECNQGVYTWRSVISYIDCATKINFGTISKL
jgi:hypothetical protein